MKLKKPIVNDIVGLLAYTLPIVGVLCIVLYSMTGWGRWQTILYALTTFILIGGASYISGGLIGFLFGIPKQKITDEPSLQRVEYVPNTNLEQISDWFTKIVVGVGLINMKEIANWIGEISKSLAGSEMGLTGDPTTFTSSLIVYFICCGFLNGYLAARIILPWVFKNSDS